MKAPYNFEGCARRETIDRSKIHGDWRVATVSVSRNDIAVPARSPFASAPGSVNFAPKSRNFLHEYAAALVGRREEGSERLHHVIRQFSPQLNHGAERRPVSSSSLTTLGRQVSG